MRLQNAELIKFSFKHVLHDSYSHRMLLSCKESVTGRQQRTADEGKLHTHFFTEPECSNNDHNNNNNLNGENYELNVRCLQAFTWLVKSKSCSFF